MEAFIEFVRGANQPIDLLPQLFILWKVSVVGYAGGKDGRLGLLETSPVDAVEEGVRFNLFGSVCAQSIDEVGI